MQKQINVEYGVPNNPTHVPARAVGRLYFQEDASGFQQFSYGRMGEVTGNFRTFVLPNEYN